MSSPTDQDSVVQAAIVAAVAGIAVKAAKASEIVEFAVAAVSTVATIAVAIICVAVTLVTVVGLVSISAVAAIAPLATIANVTSVASVYTIATIDTMAAKAAEASKLSEAIEAIEIVVVRGLTKNIVLLRGGLDGGGTLLDVAEGAARELVELVEELVVAVEHFLHAELLSKQGCLGVLFLPVVLPWVLHPCVLFLGLGPASHSLFHASGCESSEIVLE